MLLGPVQKKTTVPTIKISLYPYSTSITSSPAQKLGPIIEVLQGVTGPPHQPLAEGAPDGLLGQPHIGPPDSKVHVVSLPILVQVGESAHLPPGVVLDDTMEAFNNIGVNT